MFVSGLIFALTLSTLGLGVYNVLSGGLTPRGRFFFPGLTVLSCAWSVAGALWAAQWPTDYPLMALQTLEILSTLFFLPLGLFIYKITNVKNTTSKVIISALIVIYLILIYHYNFSVILPVHDLGLNNKHLFVVDTTFFVFLFLGIISLALIIVLLISAYDKATFKRDKKLCFQFICLTVIALAMYLLRYSFDIIYFCGAFYQFIVILFIYYFAKNYNIKSIDDIKLPDYILAATRTPYLVLDRQGNCLLANGSALSYFQIEADNLNSFNINDLLEFDTEFKTPAVRRADNTINHYNAVCRRTKAVCLMGLTYLYDKYDEFISLVVYTLDQSENLTIQDKLLKEKSQAEQASLAKSLFLAKMSHEIRTPMNAITGMSKLILREEISPTVLNYAMNIKQASANLLAIINDVLDFSKIESGRMDIVARKYELGSLLNDVINIIRMRLAEKSLLFIVHIDSFLPAQLEGDETRVRQILINLLSNAVKFTNTGHVALTVTGEPEPQTAGHFEITFTVNDTGVGIKTENLARLFTDFSQFDSHAAKGAEGTGLGLSIARSLCQAMGGDITVSSQYGEGSTFTATVIQKVINSSPLAKVDYPEDKYILIYETKALYARSLAKSINSLGLPCSTATNHLAFLAELKSRKVSHIFVASGLFEPRLLEDVNTLAPQSSLVLMVDLGEPNNRPNLPSLTMPLHSIGIAHFLNQQFDYWEEPEDQESSKFTAPNACVLIVDDLSTNLTVTEGLLAPFKMNIDCCLSGQEAIRLAQEKAYDLILMDHMMPEMDGVEATKHIRSLPGPRFESLPIVALTANAISGMREMFLENGFNDFLSKPIDISRLNEVVEKWIPRSKKVTGAVQPSLEIKSLADCRIEGLDTKLGLSLTGGKIEEYRVLMEKFCRDAVHRLDLYRKVPEPDQLMYFNSESQILRTALANLGAVSLAESLDSLLASAQRGNLAAVALNIETFYDNLAVLVEKIWAYLAI